jgi:hypothetical protein
MNKQCFARHIKLATRLSIDFARQYVINDLAGRVTYLVKPNQSYDKVLRDGEVVFPD